MTSRFWFGVVLASVATIVFSAVEAFGQTTKRLAWDQPGASLQQAQALRYRLFVDDVEQPDLLQASCVAGTPVVCSIPMPALTPGPIHALALVAVESVNGLESGRSSPFPVSVPSVPTGLRVQ